MNRKMAGLCITGWVFFSAQVLADVTVTDAWARGTVAGQTVTEVFMTLRSTEEVSLINAASPVANIVEIQKPISSGNVKAMRSIDEVALPVGETVDLKPGGYQVALIELRKPLGKGDKVPITLTFVSREGNRRSKLEITAEVRPAGAPPSKRQRL